MSTGRPSSRLSEVSSYFNTSSDFPHGGPDGHRQRYVSNNNSLSNKGQDDNQDDTIRLKKRVGLISGTALIVGTMIGSGIFVSPKGVTAGSGSVGLSLVSWAICGVVAMLGALTYAELGTMIPLSGAEYTYLLEAFGTYTKFGNIPAFLFAWSMMTLLRPASVAIIALTFAQYVLEPFYDVCDASSASVKCLAGLLILVLATINCCSVRLAVWLQNILTVAKLAVIVIIIFGGFIKLGEGHTQYLRSGFEGTSSDVGGIAIGLYNGMWAYDGWNNLNYVTEEIQKPSKNLPRSIMIGIPLVTVLYLLVNISYFTVMSVSGLLDSPAVAVTWGHRVLGGGAWIIPFFVAMSTAGAANGTIFAAGRLTFVAAREGHMLELLSMVHIKRFTPLPSLVFTAILSLIFIIPGDIESLIDFFNFAIWFFYGGTALACIVMRFTTKYKHAERPYKVPLIVPIIVLLVALFLVIAPIVDDPQIEFLYAALFVVGGLIFYVPFVHFKIHPAFVNYITCFFQLLMESSPPNVEPDM